MIFVKNHRVSFNKAYAKKQVRIGSKVFTENILLAEIFALLLEEKYSLEVDRRFNMGGTKLLFDSLKAGGIDVYPEYTGTGYTMLLKMSGETDPKKTYSIVKKEFFKRFRLIWSPPLGFENTYALAVRKSDSRFKDISTVSELKTLSQQMSLAMDHEFSERKDGLKQFSESYQLKFPKSQLFSMNPALMYSAIDNQEVDMIMAYSTDGRLQSFQLKVLEDDKNFFPAYSAAYLTKESALEDWPELKKAFQDLAGLISEEKMMVLNKQVDQLKHGISETAKNFLSEEQLLKSDSFSGPYESLTSYYWSKRHYLFQILMEHFILIFVSLFFSICFSGLIGLWAVRNFYVEKIVFSLINIAQTIPGIALLGLLIPFLGIGRAPAICALFIYSLLPLTRNIVEGIKNISADYIEASAGIGLSSGQILRHIQIPLALPLMFAGLRTAVVILVGTATLAAFIGAGGLGDPIFRGISTLDNRLIFLGAVPACLLAIALDKSIAWLETICVSKGLQEARNITHITLE